MIETPLNAHQPKSIIEEVEAHCNEISKLLVWEQNEEDHNNSDSADGSSSSSAKSNEDKIEQDVGLDHILPKN